ncbi:AraC family transcriptional regulator [Pseudohalioglobus sediminis]|uniref:AraC family transcriptional regulator n=1 Tax=Pseudohalioglobus sediminis TaxID=2606449 RepID=A0A5B0X4C3_9GAMM|nr:AraC family transcriptional regulator [Pseudohalioglobus sediminis]KAA1193478.1 AraC family transcriptional regulator [Pseudohalioglobus sediminis]
MNTMPLKTLNTLLRVVVEHGYPLERALQEIGLDYNPLQHPQPGSTQVSTGAYSKLYRLLMQILQDEAFGLGQEYYAPPGTFRMMCLFVIHCQTLEQALVRSREFFDYCDQYRQAPRHRTAGPIVALPPPAQEQVLCIFEEPRSLQSSRQHISHANVLLMMHRFYSWLIGRAIPLQAVHLRAPAPDDPQRYDKLFNCPVRFDMPASGLVLTRQLLQHPLVQTEDSLREFLRHAPYPLVKREQTGELQSLSRNIEQLLTAAGPQQLPTASDIARQLNVSPRTLHRRLTAEGTSFQQLKDNFRRELAVGYLHREDLSIDAIAAVMGFQDNSAFYRSFKKWTGVSPGQFRKRLRPQGASPDE